MLCAVYALSPRWLHLAKFCPAGPCELGSECQAPEKMHQAHYRCCHCNHGLHGMFCSSTTEDADGSITVEYLCRVVAVMDAGAAPADIIELQDSDDNKDDNNNDRSVLSPTAEDSMVASTLTKASHLKTATSSSTVMVASTKAKFTLNCHNAGGQKQSSVINYINVRTDADGKLVQTCKECGHKKSSKNPVI